MHITENELIDYVVGETDGGVVAHVAGCAECRAESDQLLEAIEVWFDDVPPMPDGLFEEAWAKAQLHFEPRPLPLRHRPSFFATVGTVAIVVIAGLLAWRVSRAPAVAPPVVPVVTVEAKATPPGQSVDDLLDIARNDKSPQKRAEAVAALRLIGGTEEKLASLYASEKEPTVREAIAKGLYMQKDASALWKLARTEKNPRMKSYIQRLILDIQSQAAQQRSASDKIERQP